MSLISEGLTTDGEPSSGNEAPDPNTSAGFDAMLVSKVAPSEQQSLPEEATGPDPSRQSAAEIRGEIITERRPTSVKEGLTFEDPLEQQPKPSPTLDTHVAEGRKALEAEQAEHALMRDELATRRFWDAYESAETPEEEALAALQLKTAAPAVYEEVKTSLDLADLEAFEDDEIDEVEDWDLSGNQLDTQVENLRAVLHAQHAEAQLRNFQENLRIEQAKVLTDVYSRQGVDVDDPAAMQQAFLTDAAALEEMGFKPPLMNPADLREQLEQLADGRAVYESELRVRQMKEEVLSADSGHVADGYEVVDPATGRLMSLQPKPDLVPSPEKLVQKINARAKARQSARSSAERVREMKHSLVAPERTSWRHALTDATGKPIDVDDATGERARLRREAEERRARARAFL